jgi:hypothetical protein
MSKLIALPLLAGMALLLASCSSEPASPTQPTTTFVGGSSMSINASPAAPAHAVSFATCRVATPFIMPFVVTVTPAGTIGFVVTGITTRFTDVGGLQAPAVTLPAPVPTIPFGSALEQARNPQSFSVDVCRTRQRGTVAVTVETRDMSGRTGSGRVTVSVE